LKRVMIDFETFGNGKHACIVQIGACYFDPTSLNGQGSVFADGLKIQVDAEDAMRNGAEMDASTVYWWLQQSPEAQRSVTATPRVGEYAALQQLNEYLTPADEIWSHATFDFVILMEALKRRGIKPGFSYRAARDIRTLTALPPVIENAVQREGTHHDALDDAVFQARYVMAKLRVLGVP
jgi:hypothetical protein